eukprot:maker-scaffold209_size256900-snap-gene-0.22 protein:Tk05656 transcript:maker-scaffold209_size256900-snap-gene-0.22-mRNA-1 annotation:"conserved hypothetical protein"
MQGTGRVVLVSHPCLSSLYAMFLIALCLVFTTTELVSQQVPLNYFETCGFYTYLYSVSILFILYLFGYVLRVRYSGKPLPNRVDPTEFIQRFTETTGLTVQEIPCDPVVEDCTNAPRRFSIRHPGNSRDGTGPELRVKLMTSQNETSHGSLFLRLGAIAFGLGTLIYSGLEFLAFFEVPQTCPTWSILLGVNPILYMAFVFIQMYFVFMHARLNIHQHKILAQFGMMHLVAANTCMVIRCLVKESAKELAGDWGEGSMAWNKSRPKSACLKEDIIGDAIEDSSLYLFPFMIEYSIIGCSMVYSMWSHIGRNPTYVMLDEAEEVTCVQIQTREPLDWSSSSVGLFLGLLSLVTLIICLILYFALMDQSDYKPMAIIINSVSDIVINAGMSLAILIGFVQVGRMDFHPPARPNDADVILVLTGFGICLYNIFNTIAGCLNTSESLQEDPVLVIGNGLAELIEVCLQILFITELRHRKVKGDNSDKPGRQIVTFLTIGNLAMWATSNFEIQKVNATPDQVEFYGFFPWIVIQRITLPLCVFFRFHSCVVFADLWKNCYRIKAKMRRGSRSMEES